MGKKKKKRKPRRCRSKEPLIAFEKMSAEHEPTGISTYVPRSRSHRLTAKRREWCRLSLGGSFARNRRDCSWSRRTVRRLMETGATMSPYAFSHKCRDIFKNFQIAIPESAEFFAGKGKNPRMEFFK